ncbi:four-carbon acid sugar kinase family protein [Sinomonas susongensis]|uniref:four-carbon acid sugar kinase family protein n=1 Tax=Sinomonas susongensis TaxID=1324851 RepID=UPI001109A077|nr:four-carbon acid sugar kinase family protein [Sinomonas susongensis]
MILEEALLANFPDDVPVPAGLVADSVSASKRVLVVLDDDPTGTQSVADLPVLTAWEPEDFRWAFALGVSEPAPAGNGRHDGVRRPAAVYVLTNTRSLDPAEAAERNRAVVTNALAAAEDLDLELAFTSRSDSTLRGHFPLETDTIAETLEAQDGRATDGVVIVPAFPDAGRVTIGGTHYTRSGSGALTPVAETEFARDATFGYSSSSLAEYVQEKSGGRYPAGTVIVLDLAILRTGTPEQSAIAIADALEPAAERTPIAVDIVTENDFRRLALGLAEAERRGKKLVYRVGPPFVRGRIGQEVRAPLSSDEALGGDAPEHGGLVVVGSHVGQTTRQLEALLQRLPSVQVVELDVERVLSDDGAHVAETAGRVAAALATGDVVVHTSRTLVTAADAAGSLAIARRVSASLVEVVRQTIAAVRPRFVVAKGGITSSDVAAHGLGIRRAMVRGPMLPGIVSLWEPMDGPALGIPYVVFAGNVGDDASLADVVGKLSGRISGAHGISGADGTDADGTPSSQKELIDD